MKSIFLAFITLFVFQFSQAQDAYKVYKMESIYLVGAKYVKNDVKYPLGFLGEKLGQEMNVSPHATAEWKNYKTVRNWGVATSVAGLGLALSALATNDDGLRQGLLIGGLSMSLVSIPISIKAGNQLQKSIWTRNRDILKF